MLLHPSGGPSPGCGRPRPSGRPVKVTGVLGRCLLWPPSLLTFCLRNSLTETPSRVQPGAKQWRFALNTPFHFQRVWHVMSHSEFNAVILCFYIIWHHYRCFMLFLSVVRNDVCLINSIMPSTSMTHQRLITFFFFFKLCLLKMISLQIKMQSTKY